MKRIELEIDGYPTDLREIASGVYVLDCDEILVDGLMLEGQTDAERLAEATALVTAIAAIRKTTPKELVRMNQ